MALFAVLGAFALSGCFLTSDNSRIIGNAGDNTPASTGTEFWALPLLRDAAAIPLNFLVVENTVDNAPSSFLSPVVSGSVTTTATLTLPSVRTDSGAAILPLAINSSLTATLHVAAPSGQSVNIFGFRRGSSSVLLQVTATRAVITLVSSTATVDFQTRAMATSTTVAYFIHAEHAGFFYAFGGASLSEVNGAVYGTRTPQGTISTFSTNSLTATYIIPAGAANGLLAERNDYFLHNAQAGALQADFSNSVVTLNLALNGAGWLSSTVNQTNAVQIEDFHMRINSNGTFDNASCTAASGANSCAGTLRYDTHGGFSSVFVNVAVGDSPIFAGGAFFGAEGQEVGGNIRHDITVRGIFRLQFIGAGAGSRPVPVLPLPEFWALPLLRDSAAIPVNFSVVGTTVNNAPHLFVSPTGAGTTLTLPAVRTGSGVATLPLDINSSLTATLDVRAPSGQSVNIFGFRRGGSNVLLQVTATRAVITLVSGATTVDFQTRAMANNATIAYFIQAEHVGFFYAFSGSSLSEVNGAVYGTRTPQATFGTFSASSLTATYTIPVGAANGLLAERNDYFLHNAQAGTLQADFSNSVVTLNLALTGAEWLDSSVNQTNAVQIEDFHMRINSDGTFDNASCTAASGANSCAGTLRYDTHGGFASVFVNVAVGDSPIFAGGAFFGTVGQEVAGNIRQDITTRGVFRLQFIGAGRGSRPPPPPPQYWALPLLRDSAAIPINFSVVGTTVDNAPKFFVSPTGGGTTLTLPAVRTGGGSAILPLNINNTLTATLHVATSTFSSGQSVNIFGFRRGSSSVFLQVTATRAVVALAGRTEVVDFQTGAMATSTTVAYFIQAEHAGFFYNFSGSSLSEVSGAAYGMRTPQATFNTFSTNNLIATYTIPPRAANGLLAGRNDYFLHNTQAGALQADFSNSVVTLNLTLNGAGWLGSNADQTNAVEIRDFHMNINSDGTFDNASCTAASGANSCGGTLDYNTPGFPSLYVNVANGGSPIFAGGAFFGAEGQEVAGNIRQDITVRGVFRLQFIGAGRGNRPPPVPLANVTTANAVHWALPLIRTTSTATTGFTVSTGTSGSPVSFIQPTSSSTTATLTLPVVRTGAGADDAVFIITAAATLSATVRATLRAEDPGGSGDSILGFVRGSVTYRLSATQGVVSLVSGNVTVSIQTKAMFSVTASSPASLSHFAYFMHAEYAAFFFSFTGTDIREQDGAVYGSRTPQGVISALAGQNLTATYTIPAGAANGQYADTGSAYFLVNSQDGILRADFANSLVTLGITLDAADWQDASNDQGSHVQINNVQMRLGADGVFNNLHCTQSGANACPGTLVYTETGGTGNTHTHANNVSSLQAGGAFFGPNAEEVAGSVQIPLAHGRFVNNVVEIVDGVINVQFIGIGKGGRQ